MSKGTPYYRLQHRRATFDTVVALRVEGVSISAIARIEGIAWNTVARWLERAAQMQAGLTPRRLTFREVFMSPTSCLSSETIPFVVTDSAMPIRIAAAPMPLAA